MVQLPSGSDFNAQKFLLGCRYEVDQPSVLGIFSVVSVLKIGLVWAGQFDDMNGLCSGVGGDHIRSEVIAHAAFQPLRGIIRA